MLKSFEPWSSHPLCVFSSFILFFLSRVCFVGSDLQGTGGRRLCVTIEPALLLKGDIMVSHMREEITNSTSDTSRDGNTVIIPHERLICVCSLLPTAGEMLPQKSPQC